MVHKMIFHVGVGVNRSYIHEVTQPLGMSSWMNRWRNVVLLNLFTSTCHVTAPAPSPHKPISRWAVALDHGSRPDGSLASIKSHEKPDSLSWQHHPYGWTLKGVIGPVLGRRKTQLSAKKMAVVDVKST